MSPLAVCLQVQQTVQLEFEEQHTDLGAAHAYTCRWLVGYAQTDSQTDFCMGWPMFILWWVICRLAKVFDTRRFGPLEPLELTKILNYIPINIICRSTEGLKNHYYRKTFIRKKITSCKSIWHDLLIFSCVAFILIYSFKFSFLVYYERLARPSWNFSPFFCTNILELFNGTSWRIVVSDWRDCTI